MVRYKICRRLVGERITKTRLESMRVTESKFDDDMALYAVTRQAVETLAVIFVTVAAGWGICGSLKATCRCSWRVVK